MKKIENDKRSLLLVSIPLVSLSLTIIGFLNQKPVLTLISAFVSSLFAIISILISRINKLSMQSNYFRQNQALIQSVKKGEYENPFLKEAEDILIKKGSYKAVVNELREALKIEPDNGKAHMRLGALYFVKAVTEGQEDLLNRAKKECIEAQRSFSDKERQVYAKQALGIVISQSGKNNAEAAKILEEAISQKSDMLLSRSDLGLVYLKMGKLKEAKQYFEYDIKKWPSASGPHLYLGNYYEEKKQFFAAIASYKKSLLLDSCRLAHLFSFWRLISCNARVGCIFEALCLCAEFLENTSKHFKLHKKARVLCILLFLEFGWLVIRNEMAKIARYLGKGIFAGPSILLMRYAQESVHDKNLDEALIAYKKATLVEPLFAGNFINLAVLYYQKGQYRKSVQAAKKALPICSRYKNKKLRVIAEKYIKSKK